MTSSNNEFKVKLLNRDKNFEHNRHQTIMIENYVLGLLKEAPDLSKSFVEVPKIGWYYYGSFKGIREAVERLEEARKTNDGCRKLYNVLKNNKKFKDSLDDIEAKYDFFYKIEDSIYKNGYGGIVRYRYDFVWLITPDGHPFISTRSDYLLYQTFIPKTFKDKTKGREAIVLGTPIELRTPSVKKHYKKCWDDVAAEIKKYNYIERDKDAHWWANKITKMYDVEYQKWIIEEANSGRYAKWIEQQRANKIIACTETKMNLCMKSQDVIEQLKSYITAIQNNDITKEKTEEINKSLNEILGFNRECRNLLSDPDVKNEELLCNKKIVRRGKTKAKENEK